MLARNNKILMQYDEFGPNMNLPSIQEFFSDKPYIGQDLVASYLQLPEHRVVAVAGEKVFDFFTGEIISNIKQIITDGEYTWNIELAYSVKKNNLRLPKTFEEKAIAYMNEKNEQ